MQVHSSLKFGNDINEKYRLKVRTDRIVRNTLNYALFYCKY